MRGRGDDPNRRVERARFQPPVLESGNPSSYTTSPTQDRVPNRSWATEFSGLHAVGLSKGIEVPPSSLPFKGEYHYPHQN